MPPARAGLAGLAGSARGTGEPDRGAERRPISGPGLPRGGAHGRQPAATRLVKFPAAPTLPARSPATHGGGAQPSVRDRMPEDRGRPAAPGFERGVLLQQGAMGQQKPIP